MGAEQVRELARLRAGIPHGLDIVAADGKYGNSRFLRQVHGLSIGVVTRFRKDRVLYRPAPPAPTPRRGHPRKHGAPFRFRDPATWGPPAEVLEFEDDQYGQVRLERWNGLHERRAPELVYDVVRASIHQERSEPPEAIWLSWLPPVSLPPNIPVTAETIWRAYVSRWPVEPGIRFCKEGLSWTRPQFQRAERGDLWTCLVLLALWVLYLARQIVGDTPLPWQKFQARLTPQRVRQSLRPIFALIGSPAQKPKPRGKPPGWPKGRPRTPQARYPVVKKGLSAAKSTA